MIKLRFEKTFKWKRYWGQSNGIISGESMASLEDYREIVGDEVITEIYQKARSLYGKHIVHVNSTSTGGGVAEMLNSFIPLMNEIGVDTGWRILHGYYEFFNVTKSFHNSLQGADVKLNDRVKNIYLDASENFSQFTHLNHDCVIIHDPQPLPLIKYYKKHQPWVWRCHIDLSRPNMQLWDYLKTFVLRYDHMIVSHPDYMRPLPVEQRIIHPAIDPLTQKNMDLPMTVAEKLLEKGKIPLDKPLMTQVSRFDIWKDPEGVVDVFKRVKKKVDCRLILCGSMATDDPEGYDIYARVAKKAANLIESGDVITVLNADDRFVNALQRRSDVIVQKSLKEGFGLTVTEAMWKGTPVVSTKVGGIPLQIKTGKTGYLLRPTDNQGMAKRIITLLKDRKLATKIGTAGREHVRKNFLTTRLLSDYLDLINYLINQGCPVTQH